MVDEEKYPNRCGVVCGAITREFVYRLLRKSDNTKDELVNLLMIMDQFKIDKINLVLGVG